MEKRGQFKSRHRVDKMKIVIIVLVVLLVGVGTAITVLAINRSQKKDDNTENVAEENSVEQPADEKPEETPEPQPEPAPTPIPEGGNCTSGMGPLMLINANFTVTPTYIANRRAELVDLAATYGVHEANAWNGTPMLDAEAAPHLAEMLAAYAAENSGHSLSTMSCFRSVGTSCGRLCAATGTSDHHSGYVCDLIDTAYGSTLDTDYYDAHPDWQWLKANSYKYGFIDRYPLAWAGSSMNEPLNVDANGTTGYYETWHYRYVGIPVATEIATGKYNNGQYDSLEHYLKMTGKVTNLLGC